MIDVNEKAGVSIQNFYKWTKHAIWQSGVIWQLGGYLKIKYYRSKPDWTWEW